MTQQPVYPGYPPQQAPQPYPPQGYQPDPAQQFMAPQQAPAYPQPYAPAPQYAPPAQQAGPPLAQGSIDDFYNQPSSGGGPSLKFETPGTRYVGIVARAVGPGDVQQQTNTQGIPLTFKDGRPKFVMKVPLQMQPTQQYPDGTAQWYVKGAARDELVRAMAEAGAPAGAPEQGAVLDITFTGTRSAGVGMNPAKLFKVVYTRPQGSGPAPQAPVGAGAPSPAPAPQVQQPVQEQPQQQVAPPVQAPAPQPVQQPVAQQFPPQQAPAAQPQVQQAQGLPAPSDLSPEQQQLLARLTGNQG